MKIVFLKIILTCHATEYYKEDKMTILPEAFHQMWYH